jgi:hypothetical protein
MKRRIAFLTFAGVALLGSLGWSFFQALPGQSMTQAAGAFLGQLTADQRKIAQLEYDVPTRVDWHFIPKDQRKGLQIKEMNDAQRTAARNLLRAALSEIGNEKARKIMELEIILRELE